LPTAATTWCIQVLPTQGFPVSPGNSYDVRAVVTDAGDPQMDSFLLLVAGSMRLVEAPTADAGGPYSGVSLKAVI
jgi:hypothetical protein